MPFPVTCSAILFDMDGTLVDSTSVVIQEWRAWADHHGLDVDEILQFSHGRLPQDVIRAVLPESRVDHEVERLRSLSSQVDQSAIVAVKGVAGFVAALPRSRWAVVTSATANLARYRLARAGIPIPDVLVSADDVHQGKPDPEGYMLAAQRLQVPPRDSIVFEDAPAGVLAARNAGMRVIALTTTHTCAQLGHPPCIPDFSSLRAAVNLSGAALEIQWRQPPSL
jgi:mannitol-1-/sugar-/sorbitol-6-phosphatase